jgi:hypothetical protein
LEPAQLRRLFFQRWKRAKWIAGFERDDRGKRTAREQQDRRDQADLSDAGEARFGCIRRGYCALGIAPLTHAKVVAREIDRGLQRYPRRKRSACNQERRGDQADALDRGQMCPGRIRPDQVLFSGRTERPFEVVRQHCHV